jgi:polysaccharide biosynthesis/export protein
MCGRYRRFLLRSLYILFVGMCCLRLMAQTPAVAEAPQPANATASPSSPRLLANSNVKLGIGDLIEIAVFGVPELSIKTRISGSGDIYLPLIDYVHVADLTTDEAQELIQKRLEDGGFVRGPHVSILWTNRLRKPSRWWERSPAPDLTRRLAIVACST